WLIMSTKSCFKRSTFFSSEISCTTANKPSSRSDHTHDQRVSTASPFFRVSDKSNVRISAVAQEVLNSSSARMASSAPQMSINDFPIKSSGEIPSNSEA